MKELEALKQHLPANVFNELLTLNISSGMRLAHFLSQIAHESGNFKFVRENLNYSAEGLKRTFEKYFTPQELLKYDRKPILIANRVYANRMGNGDEASGDGYRYRGRGYLQLTGKDNYRKFEKYIGEDILNYPDLVATKYPLTSALFFFDKNNLWKICDKGTSSDVVKELTRRINGGFNGLEDRQKKFTLFYNLILKA